MKKSIIAAAMMLLSVCALAQISIGARSEDIVKLNSGYHNLKAHISNTDTLYFLSLRSNNQFTGQIIIDLGYRDEAIVLLESLEDYDDDKSGSTIYFNNPSKNKAVLTRVFGSKQYMVYEEHGTGDIYCYLPKNYIRKYIEGLKAYGKK